MEEAKSLSEKYYIKLQAEKEETIVTINRKCAELRAEEALLKVKIAAQSEKLMLKHQPILKRQMNGISAVKNMGLRK